MSQVDRVIKTVEKIESVLKLESLDKISLWSVNVRWNSGDGDGDDRNNIGDYE